MNIRPVLAAALAAAALAVAASAQKDRILLVDGKSIEDCAITSFDLRKVEYRSKGSAATVESDLVADLVVEKARDVFRRGYAAATSPDGPGLFLAAAREQKDKFLAQFGFAEAAKLLIERGEFADAFGALEELATANPDSGYVPMLYRVKAEYYLSQGKAKAGDAASVAKKYEEAAGSQGYPRGFQIEARYYVLMAQAVAGAVDATKLRRDLEVLAGEAAAYANIADRCRMTIADSLLEEKKPDEAEKYLKELLAKAYLEPATLASALNGMGKVHFARGTPENKDAYREALLAFLRVVLGAPKAQPGVTAESLYLGAQAAEKWGGPDAATMSRRLNYMLNRDYPDNPWSKR
jgi:tetratricopeptide (TPR) repeat protein